MQRHLTGRVDDAFLEALAKAEQGDFERRSALRKTNLSYCEKALARVLEPEQQLDLPAAARAAKRYIDESAARHTAASAPHTSSYSEVASILGVDAATTRAELIARRREFARSYHPDVVPTARRSRAEDVMKIANAIIDERLLALAAKD